MFVEKRLYRRSAQIHEGLRFGKEHFLPAHAANSEQRPGIHPGNPNAIPLGQPVNRKKTQVVVRVLVLRAGISQPGDKPGHRTLFLLLFVLLLGSSGFFLLALLRDFGLRGCSLSRSFFRGSLDTDNV